MEKKECYRLGTITRTIGLKGDVSLLLDVDEPSRYQDLQRIFLEQNGKLQPFPVERISIRNNMARIKLRGVDHIDQASGLIKTPAYLPLQQLPRLEGNRFYLHEVIGYRVKDKVYGDIGFVESILEMPQHRLFLVKKDSKEVLIPANTQLVERVDHANKTLEINAPEGLIALYLD